VTASRERAVSPRAVDTALAPARRFASAKRSLEPLDAQGAGLLIEAAADIALVLDRHGVIQDLSISIEDVPAENYAGWVGRAWSEVVTVESRVKVLAMLEAAAQGQRHRWRHVNHVAAQGDSWPVMYSTVSLGARGRVVAMGRDMRAQATLQQRLVDAQQALERDYWRLRHVETRYRLLFDMAAEALVIVDAASLRVVEANPAAVELFALAPRKLAGHPFPSGVSEKASKDIVALLARARAGARGEELRLRAAGTAGDLVLGVAAFKQEDAQLLMVRARAAKSRPVTSSPGHSNTVAQVIQEAPDGFVVTDLDGQVLLANAAFVELVQATNEQQLRGESLERWMARPGVDLSVMLATLRQQGALRLFATHLRGEQGAQSAVEISAVSVPEGDPPCLGFTVRHVGRRLGGELPAAKSSPRSVEQLTHLVGRMPLKDLVRESTDLIEQLCIEAALKLTQDNRASAAEMLGLSRQSLYVKLRRYGLGDLGSASD
jgi:transcriptional regulator PpsR